MDATAIARNRFGLGARAGEAAPRDAKAWLLDQLARFDSRPAPIANAPGRAEAAGEIAEFYRTRRAERRERRMEAADDASPQMEARRAERRDVRDIYAQSVAARANAALATDTPFVERLVHFWSNHFAISADKLPVAGLAGDFEFSAIRPHVLGRFADMLGAVERHPAMLVFLDQAQSIGPNSRAGTRAAGRGRKRGLNENLAREIMELHTLGVRTGYGQADVTEFARAMTGWTVGGIGRGVARRIDGEPGAFLFAPQFHEPGTRTILGKSFAQGGEAQAQAVLAMLATHPATARHIATKLARHFAGDAPPATLVAKLEAAFLRSGGDLPTVYRALVDAPEAWAAEPVKFKTPWEWAVSAGRAVGAESFPAGNVAGFITQLGQAVWRPGSPAGFDDIAASWAGSDAIMRRVEAAGRFAGRARMEQDARTLAASLFGDGLSETTGTGIARAESPAQGLALLLVSPEFMRR
ncbi:DUF1800 domain-containing protein [Sphingomonas gilva]|uniref:DUF1800 domain-containing protein n=1 Tax=Sphingomonas gilva TaxID=2305907 RepID=A0A396RNT5_9SPHN|nr:DUF1800 domain-containing protein [Sphingomonas gilva]RHW18039.1 DUF1800 domain-containing protein [Sphingomonas gilva]